MVRLKRIPAFRAAGLLTLTIGIPYGVLTIIFWLFLGVGSVTTSFNGSTTTTSFALQSLTNSFLSWLFAMLSTWVFVAISCALYNLIAGRLGGIELEFTTIPPES